MTEQRYYYRLLDLARLFCALLIIFIHMGFGDSLSVVPCLSRQGVPFFFLVSGFLFSKKAGRCESIRELTIQYIKPIILVYLIWILFWMPSIVLEYRQLYSGSLIKLIVVLCRRFFLAGIAPYWYLLVLAEGILVLAWIIHNDKRVVGTILCVLGIVLCIIYGYQARHNQNGLIYRVFYTVFSWDCNVIMSGFPLLFIGMMIDLQEERIRRGSFWILLILYLISVASAFFCSLCTRICLVYHSV